MNYAYLKKRNSININLIHFEGDSITACAYFADINNRYSNRFASAYPDITVRNTAVGSSVITIGTNSVLYRLNNSIPDATTDEDYFSVFIGSNVTALGGSGATAWSQLQQVLTAATNKGYKLIVWTTTGYSSAYSLDPGGQNRIDYNTLIAANAVSLGYIVVDTRTISKLNTWDGDLTYWRNAGGGVPDIIHPNEYSHSLLNPLLIQTLQSNSLI